MLIDTRALYGSTVPILDGDAALLLELNVYMEWKSITTLARARVDADMETYHHFWSMKCLELLILHFNLNQVQLCWADKQFICVPNFIRAHVSVCAFASEYDLHYDKSQKQLREQSPCRSL